MTTASSGPSLTAPTSTLTIREKLLFSQAVHKVGAGEPRWTQVGDLLRECPVVDRPEGYWSDVACRGIYDALMEETGFDKLLVPAQQSQPHAEAHLYLAQHYYELRMQEIRAEIEGKEEKFRSLAVEINAIKSGEAIYNPGIMLRLRDILLDRRRAAKNENKNKGDENMDVDVEGGATVTDGDDRAKRDTEMDVEMKVGEMGENGKRTGGMALFKEKEEVVWRMTEEDLRLAARGTLPPGQRRPLPPAPIPVSIPVDSIPSTATSNSTPTTATSNKIEFAKEDAPIQAQAPVRKLTPEPPLSIDVDMDGPVPSSQPASAGPSKRSTPVPGLGNSTRSTPQPSIQLQNGRAVSTEIIREDAPLQAQGPPPTRVSPLPPVVMPIQPVVPTVTRVVPTGPTPVTVPSSVVTPPVPVSLKETATTAAVSKAVSSRPVPRKRRTARKATTPPAEENSADDRVPDSQETPVATSPAHAEPDTSRERNKNGRVVSDSKKRKAEDQDSNRIHEEAESKHEPVRPMEVDGDDNRLVTEADEVEPKKLVSDQSSEDDLTPPPMSPNLPPVENDSPVPEPDSTPPRRREREEKARKTSVVPSTRRGQAKEARDASVNSRKRAASNGSGDELSPVPSTPVTKRQKTDAKVSEAEEETQSEMEMTSKPKRIRGQPKVRVTEDPAAAKKSEDEGQDQGARRTRRQETAKRPSTRNANANKHDMSSPPPSVTTKRSSRPTPERQTRTRGGRTRASKDKDETEEPDDEGDEEDKPEEPAVVRRSGRHARTMPDLREQDEDNDEEEEDDEAESAEEEADSPAATIDSDKRTRPGDRRQRDKDKTGNKKATKDEPNKKDDQRREEPRAAENDEVPELTNKGDAVDVDAMAQTPPSPGPSVRPAGAGEEEAKDGDQPPHDEPAMPETTASRKTRSATNAIMTETTTRQFKNKMNQLHQEVLGHKHGPIFNAAVRASDAPGYYDVVKRPMDLKKIKANIKNGTIRTIDDFQRDLYLMFCNAMMYNKPTSEVHHMAEEMMEWCEGKISDYKNAEALATSRS